MDESGTEPGGVVTPIPVTESMDASGYESVSMLGPNFLCRVFRAVPVACWWLSLGSGPGRSWGSLPVACGLLSRSSFFSVGSKFGRGAKLACVEAQK